MWLDPFHYSFMWNGFAAAILAGALCGPLGTYVVLRRLAFLGDALAHAILPGLVIATLLKLPLLLGGVLAGIVASFAITYVSRERTVGEDSAIGVVFTSLFALGVLLLERIGGLRSLHSMLFGNILSVTRNDLILMALLTIGALSAFALFHRQIELATCDEEYGRTIGIPMHRVRLGLLLLLSLTVVIVTQLVGVVLTSALLIVPALTVQLFLQRLRPMLLGAALLAAALAVAGLYISYFTHTSSGATIVLLCTTTFLAARAFRSARTLAGRAIPASRAS